MNRADSVATWSRERRFSPLPWLLMIITIFVLINARWIWIYRHTGLRDIDEAGYLCYSLIDYYGLHFNGFRGWLAAIGAPSIQAPLTMVLTSLLYAIAGPHLILGFVVTVGAAAGCIGGAYMLGGSLGSSRVGLMAAVITASCPDIVNFARSYQFSMPATLMMTLTLVAMLRSRRFLNLRWSFAFGILLGLMPLARTMVIAFVPGIIAAALVAVLADPAKRWRRLQTFGGACILAALAAATWFVPNGSLVAEYLFNFGYGNHALEYGKHTSTFGLDAWLAMAKAFTIEIYLPHLLLFFLGLVATLCVAVREMLNWNIIFVSRRIMLSSVLPIVVVVFEVIFALTTSSNKGNGFFAPIVPALAVLTAYSFDRLSSAPWIRTIFFSIVVSVVLVSTLPMLDLRTRFAPNWTVDFPFLGNVPVSDGRGTIQLAEADAGYGLPHQVQPIDQAESKEWLALSVRTAETLTERVGLQAVVAYGFRNALYNVNTVNLEQLLRAHSAFGEVMIDPIITGESVAGYLNWLTRDCSNACALLTSDKASGDFLPVVNRKMMEAAAIQANFVPKTTWAAPDGQTITLWQPKVTPKGCS